MSTARAEEGYVGVFRQDDPDRYHLRANVRTALGVPTALGARTAGYFGKIGKNGSATRDLIACMLGFRLRQSRLRNVDIQRTRPVGPVFLEAEFHLEFDAAIVGRFEEPGSPEARSPRTLIGMSEERRRDVAYYGARIIVIDDVADRGSERNCIATVF